jgi:hypothetical protein
MVSKPFKAHYSMEPADIGIRYSANDLAGQQSPDLGFLTPEILRPERPETHPLLARYRNVLIN